MNFYIKSIHWVADITDMFFKARMCDPNENWKTVAVKIPRVSKSSKNPRNDLKLAYKALLSEARIMSYVGGHPNIVELVGVLTDTSLFKVNLNVCIEYCALQSLNKYLREIKFNSEEITGPLPTTSVVVAETSYTNHYLTSSNAPSKHRSNLFDKMLINIRRGEIDDSWEDTANSMRLTNDYIMFTSDLHLIAYQVSCGMEFLGSKHVLHRDLAARNVLLTEKRIAKVADFGLAAEAQKRNQIESTAGLPFINNAPEMYHKGFFDYAKNGNKSDVWSYGVLLWEMFTFCKEKIYSEWRLEELPGKQQLAEYLKRLTKGNRFRNRDDSLLRTVTKKIIKVKRAILK